MIMTKRKKNNYNDSHLSATRFASMAFFATLIIATTFVGAISILGPQTASAQTLGTPINLSNNTGRSYLPEIARSGDSFVYVIWRDDTTGNGDIYFKRSTDGGKTFGSLINLSNNVGISEAAKIVATGPYVYVVWSDESANPGKGEIYFRASSNNGASFGSIKNLSSNSGGDSAVPQLRADGTNVYVVWSDDNGAGGRDIYLKRSTNNGVDFGSSKIKVSTSGKASQPTISSQGSFVYVVWRDRSTGNGDIYFKRSTNAGSSFGSSLINLSGSSNSGDSILPLIRSTSSFVYVTWRDASTGNGDIYFRRSTDNGATMQSLKNLSADTIPSGRTDDGPDMDVSGTNVFVTWSSKTGGISDCSFEHILVKKISSNGGTLNPTRDITIDAREPNQQPRISASGNYVYVIWVNLSSCDVQDQVAYISRSTDAGGTFNPRVRISYNGGASDSVTTMISEVIIASSSTGKAYVVAPDETTTTNREILFTIAS